MHNGRATMVARTYIGREQAGACNPIIPKKRSEKICNIILNFRMTHEWHGDNLGLSTRTRR